MKQQLQFLGRCMRKGGIEKIILVNKIAGNGQEREANNHISPKNCRMEWNARY